MDDRLVEAIEKQNELQTQANDIMRGLIAALQGLAQEIADMPEVQAARERKRQVGTKAATGKYATPEPPSGGR